MFTKPKIAVVKPLKDVAVPMMPPTRPVLHVAKATKPLAAEDPQLLEKALLRRMKNNG